MEIVGVSIGLVGVAVAAGIAVWQKIRADSLEKELKALREQMARSETRAEVRHQELVDLNDIFIKLPTEHFTEDAVYVDLPEGARLVRTVGGPVQVALPVRLEGRLRTVGIGGAKRS